MSDTFEITVKKVGFFDGEMRKVGTKLDVTEDQFSENWMTKGDYEAPEPIDNSNVEKAEDIKHEPLEIPSNIKKERKKRRTKEQMEAARLKEEKAKEAK